MWSAELSHVLKFVFRQSDQISKKLRSEIDLTSDDTIFQLLQQSKIPSTANLAAPNHVVNNFSNILQQPPREIEYDDDPSEEEEILKPSATLPIDWSLKSRMRILSRTQIPGNNLKSNQEASGLTGFVRCLDIRNTSGGLDISPGARFHQCSMFWQYPHLPWLNLIQRNNKANNNFKMGEQESQSLLSDWSESFRNLFQLLRARQCPYFYVCANTFTALFRAAGIGGRSEMHVLLTPTTRGLRQLLKQKDIEFIQPLKQSLANKSGNSNTPNTSLTNSSDDATKDVEAEDNESDDEDMDDENWLKSLGVDQEDIKRINFTETRKEQKKECEDDFGDQSTALIEGVDCQAFFNFLLNAKTIVPKVGRLAGVPATLLAPSAFLGATLRKQTIRTSKVRVDGVDYCSMELKGVILPHTLHSLCQLLTEIKDSFSCTMASFNHTVAFTKVSQRIIEGLLHSFRLQRFSYADFK